jgi:DNA polymerase-3 subunit gamma/tau
MGQALYRTNRPKQLGDIVGQQHITKTLEQALKSGRISHAYLFTGPRGTGKTSIARILAHEINGLPYTDDSMHMDIIEIDAASNRRIDEIRDLRDKVHIAPTSAKYKVYIIDEVHMLTKEAFNALLKTLEEPPEHVIFILATTEIHKLPETIISRTQRFAFKPVDVAQVAAHLKTIALKENISIDDHALEFLAAAGEGSFRDSISLLDQIGASGQRVGLQAVQTMLGIPPVGAIDDIISALASGVAPAQIITRLEALYDGGYQPVQIAHQLIQNLRASITSGEPTVLDSVSALDLMKRLIDTARSYDPQRYLEIILIDQVTDRSVAVAPQTYTAPPVYAPANTAVTAPQQQSAPAKKIQTVTPKKEVKVTRPPEPAHRATFDNRAEAASPSSSDGSVPDNIDFWPEVLDTVRKQYYTLYSVLKTAEPRLTEEGLELACTYPFHQKRIKEAKNTHIIDGIIKDITGKDIAWTCIVRPAGEPAISQPELATNAAKPDLNNISNIFGGGELLES